MLDLSNDVRQVARMLGRTPGVTDRGGPHARGSASAPPPRSSASSTAFSSTRCPTATRTRSSASSTRSAASISRISPTPIYLAYAGHHPGVRGPGRLGARRDRDDHRPGRARTGALADGEPGRPDHARRGPGDRALVLAGRRYAGSAGHRDARPRLLAAAIRRRPRRARARAHHRRPPAADRRRDAGRLPLRRRVRDRPAAADRSRCADSVVPAARRGQAAIPASRRRRPTPTSCACSTSGSSAPGRSPRCGHGGRRRCSRSNSDVVGDVGGRSGC